MICSFLFHSTWFCHSIQIVTSLLRCGGIVADLTVFGQNELNMLNGWSFPFTRAWQILENLVLLDWICIHLLMLFDILEHCTIWDWKEETSRLPPTSPLHQWSPKCGPLLSFIQALVALFLSPIWGTTQRTDTNNEAPFHPLTPKVGHNASHWQQDRGTIPSININDGASFLPLIPVMGQDFSSYWPQVLCNFFNSTDHQAWGIIYIASGAFCTPNGHSLAW